MRRLLAVFVLAWFALPLVAAAPASGTKPTVIVYPFTANGSTIDREASSRLATIIATQMANTGQIAVLPPPPGTERKDFLSVARANNADYYIAGFISSLGDGVSVVEQVVSTTTGIVVFSNTAQLKTYADAAGQGDDLATFVSRHANRAYASIGTPPPAASPTQKPAGEAQTSLSKLFGRKKKPAATAAPVAKASAAPAPAPTTAAALINVTPTPSPVAVAAAPATAKTSVIAVLPVSGSADADLRTAAALRIADRAHADRAESTTAACGDHPHDTILAGSLAIKSDPTYGGSSATFALTATNCAGKTLWSRTFTNAAGGAQGAQVAMERAVDAAVGAYLNPPKKRRLL